MARPVEKAYLQAIDSPHTRVEFPFNPSKYTISRAIDWKAGEQKGKDMPETDFVTGQGRTMKLELFVDRYEGDGNVQDFVEELEGLATVDPSNVSNDNKRRPTFVRFGWGRQTWFKAAITNLDVSYTLFHSDGRPARATVSLSLKEVKDEPGGQNPTSGGEPGRRSHMVLPGETLDLIAYQELGDASHWPHIAEINKLDNPFAIRGGQSLVITPAR